MNKVSFIFSKKSLEYNVDKYNLNNNILYVTGLSGSGKTFLSKELSRKYNAILMELDNLGGFYGEYKFSDSIIHQLTKQFLDENSKLDSIIKKSKFIELKIKNFQEYSKWINKYTTFLENYAHSKEQYFIFEGTQIFKCLKPKYFSNKPLIIVRTSALISLIRRIKRQKNLDKIKGKNKFYRKHLLKLLNDSKRLHFKDVIILNKFLNQYKKEVIN